jgi:hypothetical protein
MAIIEQYCMDQAYIPIKPGIHLIQAPFNTDSNT